MTSIHSPEESEFVTNLAGQDVWLGLKVNSENQSASETSWPDGSLVTYRNWSESDPASQHVGKLGILEVSGGWTFVASNALFPYVCETGK
jgi:hypothetical protein